MVTYIVIEHDKQADSIETSKPFFSHKEAEDKMWECYAKHMEKSVEEAKKYADNIKGVYYDTHYVCDSCFYEAEIHSVIFSEDDMLISQILEAFYKEFPYFADYKFEWRAQFQDTLTDIIKRLLPRYEKHWMNCCLEDFVHEVLIGEELYQAALEALGGDNDRTEELLEFIDGIWFENLVCQEYGTHQCDALVCGLLALCNGDEEMIEKVRSVVNEWCDKNDMTPIFKEKQYVYRVAGYYDMNVGSDEEIIQEIYADEKTAQQRVRYLIDTYKENSHAIEDTEPYGGEWDEDEYRLYAYSDSEWNVDIHYTKEEVLTELKNQ